jgi:hypothetical protein
MMVKRLRTGPLGLIRIKAALPGSWPIGGVISLDDCIALCGLTPAEVAAIAEHEHLPDVVAATLGRYLLDQTRGGDKIRDMLVDDIRAALQSGRPEHAALLTAALRHFVANHHSGI